MHFHKLNYLEKKLVSVPGKADELKRSYFSENKLRLKLEDVLSKELSEGCLILEMGNNQITLEVLSNTNDYIFARLGKMQDIKTVHLRDKKTLRASPIQKAIDQEIEIFTYLIINKYNMVVTYITELGAPQIKKIERIAKRYFSESEYLEVVPILVPDALEVLKKKKKISKMDYKIALPINDLLDKDHLNLPVDDILKLRELKSATIEISITGKKDKNIVDDIKNNLSTLVEKVKGNKFGDVKQLSFNAKNEGEYTHKYNIFDEIFVRKTRMNTKQIDRKIDELDYNDEDYHYKVQEIIHEEIKQNLLSVYKVNEEDLENYIKVS